MPAINIEVSTVFTEIADLLDIQGANPFRIRAYRNAARTLGDMSADLKVMIERGDDLTEIPGIGKDLAAKVREIVETGSCSMLKRLQQEVPPAVSELLHIPGLGPKRVSTLWHELDIQSVAQLQRAARAERIRHLPGFGIKTEQKILEAANARLDSTRRMNLHVAEQYAEQLTKFLRKINGVKNVAVAGSYRRMRETVGDLDILVAAADGHTVIEQFARLSDVREILAQGETRCSVVLRSGVQVDLRLVPNECYGAALLYFTGSKAHNIALRRLARDRSLKINEYGIFKGNNRLAGNTEESMYRAVGLPWIAPELREDLGEIEAAMSHKLPRLVELKDLRGDLHVHTKASDGQDSIVAMAEAAREHGLSYIAITDHSRRLTVAHGLDSVRLAKQADEIKRVSKTLSRVQVLAGVEVDILEDGRLDLPDSILAEMEVVVAAVHSKFEMPKAQQTKRIIAAINNPYVHILAHPSGRLINERQPCEIDMQQVMRHAKARGVALELNSNPQRLDLNDTYCRMARDEGVTVVINSDAHAIAGFGDLRFGIGQARRGWLEKKNILNTRTLADLKAFLRKRGVRNASQ
ncbi:MAG: DNA polymerase/3'-5' exonuclease PolX [Gammaproteobacteria bacterium]